MVMLPLQTALSPPEQFGKGYFFEPAGSRYLTPNLGICHLVNITLVMFRNFIL
jgi:hypothetical protein